MRTANPALKDNTFAGARAAALVPSVGDTAAPEVLPGWGREGSQAWFVPAGTPRAVQAAQQIAMIATVSTGNRRVGMSSFSGIKAPGGHNA